MENERSHSLTLHINLLFLFLLLTQRLNVSDAQAHTRIDFMIRFALQRAVAILLVPRFHIKHSLRYK